jgi:hypothetical protein
MHLSQSFKILPLHKALEEAKKYRLAFQNISTISGLRRDLIISNPTPTTHPTIKQHFLL